MNFRWNEQNNTVSWQNFHEALRDITMASETEISKETHQHFKAPMHRFAQDAAGCREQEHLPSFEPLRKFQYEDLNIKNKTFSME